MPASAGREKALHNIQVGDLFNVDGNHGAPITCLATAITDTTIHARSIAHQVDFKFDRKTGVGKGEKYSLGGTIDSVEPLPPDINEALIGLDRRFRAGSEAKLSRAEFRALIFIDSFYKAHPIEGSPSPPLPERTPPARG